MRVLVSVSNAREARAAVRGGADIIDAKDPSAGALGAVTPGALRAIHAAVAGARPLSAALGDAIDGPLTAAAAEAAAPWCTFVKLAFAGRMNQAGVETLIRAARQGADTARSGCAVVAAAYADWEPCGAGPAPLTVIEAAAQAGAAGVLVDTADKAGAGLTSLVTAGELARWAGAAHARGLWLALAGRLGDADLDTIAAAGADIAGIRGAVCAGGRTGVVREALVRRVMLRAARAQVQARAASR